MITSLLFIYALALVIHTAIDIAYYNAEFKSWFDKITDNKPVLITAILVIIVSIIGPIDVSFRIIKDWIATPAILFIVINLLRTFGIFPGSVRKPVDTIMVLCELLMIGRIITYLSGTL